MIDFPVAPPRHKLDQKMRRKALRLDLELWASLLGSSRSIFAAPRSPSSGRHGAILNQLQGICNRVLREEAWNRQSAKLDLRMAAARPSWTKRCGKKHDNLS